VLDTIAILLKANDLRFKAEHWRHMTVLFTDKQAIDALNDLAAGLEKQADEMEAALAAVPPRASAVQPQPPNDIG
jgi:hypothetical protein